MTLISPDVGTRLKPDLMVAITTIYRDLCNLQPNTNVLIIADARTPEYVVAAFQGIAQALGADSMRAECKIPAGGPTYQPGARWSPMLMAASERADLIIDMAVGYADFIVAALKRGCRVLCPGDGIGGGFMDDVLIRAMVHTDIQAIRRHADKVAARFTTASHCTVFTGLENDRFDIDFSGLEGIPADGFLWDPDRKDWKSNWAFLPPAQPGVFIPKGRGDGVVNVDGNVLYHSVYMENPKTPLRLEFRDGVLRNIGGDAVLANVLANWLDCLDDKGARIGPVHLNVGLNPNAVLSQGQEWERVYGSITCGMGDLGLLGLLMGETRFELNRSTVHWDWTVMQPRIVLDGETVVERGRVLIH
jgi:hypothetical protein